VLFLEGVVWSSTSSGSGSPQTGRSPLPERGETNRSHISSTKPMSCPSDQSGIGHWSLQAPWRLGRDMPSSTAASDAM
jgi:hypothetical protein